MIVSADIPFPLPRELRDKILTDLLVDPENLIDLRPTKLEASGPWNLRHIWQDSLGYTHQYRMLSQVSRAMRREAQEVFFGQNQWYLEVQLARERIYTSGTHVPIRGEIIGSNTPAFISETWGTEALAMMGSVQIYISGTDFAIDESLRWIMKDLANSFKKANNLKCLEVQWDNKYSLEKCRERDKALEKQKIALCSRKNDGTRKEPIPAQNIRWAEQEKILEPLSKLKGLKRATVFGSVTDEWALWLEQCMTSNEESVPEFKRLNETDI